MEFGASVAEPNVNSERTFTISRAAEFERHKLCATHSKAPVAKADGGIAPPKLNAPRVASKSRRRAGPEGAEGH